ncbi:SDR family NAD(P)-dependent oxidoreductase [Streptomyces sp. NPDC060053]|uniref:SDR family NAD(P)-dependent oxidoreductase n=1 Tax=Streptomyces sp. NPDC060053 TaxID=3347047 RepID=UPI0036B0CCDC
MDLSTEAGAKEWIEAGISVYGGIDILYNNASALRNGPFDTQPVEDWYFTLRNELDIPYLCTRAAWPHLVARGGGAILNVASVAAVRGAPFLPMVPHGAAKGGVPAMSKHLCAAGAPHRIRVNTIAPGMTRTSATAPFLDDPEGAEGPPGGADPRRPDRRAGGHRPRRGLPLQRRRPPSSTAPTSWWTAATARWRADPACAPGSTTSASTSATSPPRPPGTGTPSG